MKRRLFGAFTSLLLGGTLLNTVVADQADAQVFRRSRYSVNTTRNGDWDRDGIPNYRDRDDDNDRILDSRDRNDYSRNRYSRYGYTNYGTVRSRVGGWRGDFDRDGVPNRWDRDRDGDGRKNKFDRRPNSPHRR